MNKYRSPYDDLAERFEGAKYSSKHRDELVIWWITILNNLIIRDGGAWSDRRDQELFRICEKGPAWCVT